jgi:hypothetical protein
MELQGKHQENWGGNYGGGTLSDTLTGNGEPIANRVVADAKQHRELYGEGGGFPQVRAVVNQVSSCYLWLVPTPRMIPNVN